MTRGIVEQQVINGLLQNWLWDDWEGFVRQQEV